MILAAREKSQRSITVSKVTHTNIASPTQNSPPWETHLREQKNKFTLCYPYPFSNDNTIPKNQKIISATALVSLRQSNSNSCKADSVNARRVLPFKMLLLAVLEDKTGVETKIWYKFKLSKTTWGVGHCSAWQVRVWILVPVNMICRLVAKLQELEMLIDGPGPGWDLPFASLTGTDVVEPV